MKNREVFLGEVADTCLGKMLDQNKNKGKYQPYLANVNVRWGDFDLENLPQMRFEEDEEERYGLQFGDILVCEGGEPGRCAIWKNQLPNMKFQKALHRVRVHNDVVDYRWLYYRLLYAKSRNEFDQYFSGTTTIKHMPREKLIKIRFLLPDINSQKRIADILSAYDDLIENNRRQIKLLEEAARRLYREWFVDFRFPGHEQMLIVDGVPEGWTVKTIEEVASLLRRGISPVYNERGMYTVISQKCIRSSIMDISEARKQEKVYVPELNLQDSDTVICSTGAGTLGRVGQVFGDYPNTTFDSHVTVVRADNAIGKQYLYLSIKEKEDYLKGMGKGSTNQLELYRDVVKSIRILVPSIPVLKPFENNIQTLHDKIVAVSSEITRTLYIRNQLLMKLMKGEDENA